MNATLKGLLKRTPLYPLYRRGARWRDLRRRLRQYRQWTEDDRRWLEFYAQFARSGDTVFDVGANFGNRTKVFLRLGAKVVAVEPQAQCADFLRYAWRRDPSFRLDRKALGATPGGAELMVASAATLSSLSPEWVRAVQESGRFRRFTWDNRERVAVDTLDNLIREHGVPAFVKIDVEGFESQVLAGLSQPVGALSVEFHHEHLGDTLACLDRLEQLGATRFQLSFGETARFALPDWAAAAQVRAALAALPRGAVGDLYAR